MTEQHHTDLSQFDNSWYRPGSKPKRALWYVFSVLFFQSRWFPFSGVKCGLLKMFGAEVGRGVVIKPQVTIKYPWKLQIGDHVWVGEGVWIDNLDEVRIGSHSCISQGALLLCGNHDYRKPTFDLITKPITLEPGAWVGAKSVVTGGVVMGSHAVLSVGSVASKELDAYGIYRGNPAEKVKERKLGQR